jgi:hypothetical protein
MFGLKETIKKGGFKLSGDTEELLKAANEFVCREIGPHVDETILHSVNMRMKDALDEHFKTNSGALSLVEFSGTARPTGHPDDSVSGKSVHHIALDCYRSLQPSHKPLSAAQLKAELADSAYTITALIEETQRKKRSLPPSTVTTYLAPPSR